MSTDVAVRAVLIVHFIAVDSGCGFKQARGHTAHLAEMGRSPLFLLIPFPWSCKQFQSMSDNSCAVTSAAAGDGNASVVFREPVCR